MEKFMCILPCICFYKYTEYISTKSSMIKHFLTCPFSGSNLIAKLMKMQLMEEDDDLAYGASPDDEDKPMADGRPAWMRTLHTSVSTWMSLIPKVKKNLRSVFLKCCHYKCIYI